MRTRTLSQPAGQHWSGLRAVSVKTHRYEKVRCPRAYAGYSPAGLIACCDTGSFHTATRNFSLDMDFAPVGKVARVGGGHHHGG